QSADGQFARTVVDKNSTVKVTNHNGRLNLSSDGNIVLKAAQVESAGTLTAKAGDTLDIGTLGVYRKEHHNGNADNYYRLEQRKEEGSSIRGQQGTTLLAEQGIILRQANVSSEAGPLTISVKQGDIQIEAGRETEKLATAVKYTARGWLNKKTTMTRHLHENDQAIGSHLEGQSIHLQAQQGSITSRGSAIVGKSRCYLSSKR
ncbi:hypothetical protein F9B74_09835, partial [Pelistega sp. NLN82]